jgi:hypothetical protein
MDAQQAAQQAQQPAYDPNGGQGQQPGADGDAPVRNLNRQRYVGPKSIGHRADDVVCFPWLMCFVQR